MLTYTHDERRARIMADDLIIEVEATDLPDPERRVVWRYALHTPQATALEGCDMRTGAHGFGSDGPPMLRTLASFLDAYADSSDDGEHADLFPGLNRGLAADAAELIWLTAGDDSHVCWTDDTLCHDCGGAA